MTRMMFSRRTLQLRLNGLRAALPSEPIERLIGRLECLERSSVGAVWELAWLSALARVVPDLQHEQPLSDGSRPDFSLIWRASSIGPTPIIGDITTVSDKGLEDQNPLNFFWDAVLQCARKHRVDPNKLNYHVDGHLHGSKNDEQVTLALPPRSQINQFIKTVVTPFFAIIAQCPTEPSRFEHDTNGAVLLIEYVPEQRLGSGSYASFNTPLSIRRSPILTALKIKADQLRSAPNDTLRLVILCDGGCAALRDNRIRPPGSFSAQQLVDRFLASTTAVDAVLIVMVEKIRPNSTSFGPFRIATDLRMTSKRPERLTQTSIEAVQEFCNTCIAELPQPMLNADNAIARSNNGPATWGHHGGGVLSMKGGRQMIRFSSRCFLELLAGRMTYEQFLELHDFVARASENALATGQRIASACIVDDHDSDDDWIELTFESDPAIALFK